jgi:hypothetical protein
MRTNLADEGCLTSITPKCRPASGNSGLSAARRAATIGMTVPFAVQPVVSRAVETVSVLRLV